MASARYKLLFRITLSHSFFKDRVCKGLNLRPTPACTQVMRDLGLLFRATETGGRVFYRVRDNDQPFTDFQSIADGKRLSFYLDSKDDSLHYFTSLGQPLNLPYYPVHQHLFLFTDGNGISIPGGGGTTAEINLLPGTTGAVYDSFPLETADIPWSVQVLDLTESPATPFELDQAGELVLIDIHDTPDPDLLIQLSVGLVSGNADFSVAASVNGIDFETVIPVLNLNGGSPNTAAFTVPASLSPGVRFLRFELLSATTLPVELDQASLNLKGQIPNQDAHHIPEVLPVSYANLSLTTPDTGANTAQLSIFGPDPDQPGPLQEWLLESEGGNFNFQGSLQDEPIGVYRLELTPAGGNTQIFFRYLDPFAWRDRPFGVVEMAKSGLWEAITDPMDPQTEVNYSIRFTPRKSIWRYYVIHRSTLGRVPHEIRVEGASTSPSAPRLFFEERTSDFLGPDAEFEGVPAQVFMSVYDAALDQSSHVPIPDPQPPKPILFQESGYPEINLYRSGPPDRLVRRNLPNPLLTSANRHRVSQDVLFSDVFIYV